VSYAVDANVLLHASDESSPVHRRARDFVEQISAGPEIVYLFWPVVTAYLRIATHPAVFARPLSIAEAVANVDQLLARRHVRTTGEVDAFWRVFRDVIEDSLSAGNLVADAHLVALMRQNDVRTIWTRDRDYRRFSGIEVRDPFA
jgi:toxin-antitoxin system PIN domain toxin